MRLMKYLDNPWVSPFQLQSNPRLTERAVKQNEAQLTGKERCQENVRGGDEVFEKFVWFLHLAKNYIFL